MERANGFTIIELMLVTVIIAVLAAILVPLLLRGRVQANESSAVNSMRAISTAETTFHHAELTYGELAELGATDPPYVDESLAVGEKHGYSFETSDVTEVGYRCQASPVSQGKSGIRGFFTDESGIIRVDPSGTADEDSDPID